jgi:hypothetical protein
MVIGLEDLLRMRIRFQTPSQALQIFTYNALLLYLTKLGAPVTPGGNAAEWPLSPQAFSNIRREARRANGRLILPRGFVHPCQAAIEATRALRYLVESLKAEPASRCTIVTFTLVNIVYESLLEQPDLRVHLEALRADFPAFRSLFVAFRNVEGRLPIPRPLP